MNASASPPQLTVRAVVLAIVLAMILAAANTYLGLFAGMTIASAIPAAVVSMARALNLEVVAEGVESFEQLLQLRDQQCHEAQGYLLGRPVPARDAEQLLVRLAETRDAGRTLRLRALTQ